MQTIRNRMYCVLDNRRDSKLSKYINGFIYLLIILNVIAVILETEKSIYTQMPAFFHWFELISVALFSIEYVLRIWTITENPRFSRPVLGRIRYAFTFLAIIDLLAILPAFLPLLIPVDLRFLRLLRLFRMLRVFKLGRYSRAMKLIGNVLKEKKAELAVAIFSTFLFMIVAASLLYTTEHAVQPEKFSSIPAATWWAVCSLTTVGYGDMVPVTFIGKILAGLISILSIGMFALPAGILASGFSSKISKD